MGPGGFALCAVLGWAARCSRGWAARRPARWYCSWPHGCSGRRVACLDGPGRCVCRWAAARPRDRHTRACGSERSISRPALALPPPTGTAARPRVLQLARALRSLRRPPHRWGLVCWRVAWRVGSLSGQAPPPPTGTAAWSLKPLRRPPHRWCPVAAVWFGACCYKRRQSELLIVRFFLRLLQTSSIRRHFCEK